MINELKMRLQVAKNEEEKLTNKKNLLNPKQLIRLGFWSGVIEAIEFAIKMYEEEKSK